MDLSVKSSGFTDFENTVDCGSAVLFDADCGLCLSNVRTLGPKRNLDHRFFFSLDRYTNKFIQIISFFERSLFYLRCETVMGIVALLTIWAKLTVAFTCTTLPLNLYTSVFRIWLWCRIWTEILADRRIWRKKGTDWRICIPLFTPLRSDPTRNKHKDHVVPAGYGIICKCDYEGKKKKLDINIRSIWPFLNVSSTGLFVLL